MILRNDIRQSSTVIPKALRETILRVGGTNIFDEPMFRLLLAEDRTIKAAGAWNVWPKGTSVEDRGGLGISNIQKMIKQGCSTAEINEYVQGRTSVTPITVVRGMVDRPLYQFGGFVLEKWKPAESFGSPVDWYAFRFEGEPALGPYPTHGDYELCAGPTPYMPTSAEVEEAIRRTYKEIEDRPSTPMARMSQMLSQMEAAEETQAKEQHAVIDAKYKEDKMLYKTVSLGAGRARNVLAEGVGIKEHYGN